MREEGGIVRAHTFKSTLVWCGGANGFNGIPGKLIIKLTFWLEDLVQRALALVIASSHAPLFQ